MEQARQQVNKENALIKKKKQGELLKKSSVEQARQKVHTQKSFKKKKQQAELLKKQEETLKSNVEQARQQGAQASQGLPRSLVALQQQV